MTRDKYNQPGFTIIELMVTLAVLAILVSIAAPNMRAFLQNNRATAQTNQLVTAMNLARSEAVRRGQIVSICTSDDGNNCRTDGNDPDNWADGWILFEDENQTITGSPTLGGNDVLRAWGQLRGGTTLTADGDSFARFSPQGRLMDDNGMTFDLAIPDCTGDNARQIAVTASGRVSVTRQNCG